MAPIPYWECMVFTMWGRYCSQQIDIERAITVSNNGHSFQLIMYNLRELFHRFGSILGACFAGLPIPIASSSINCIRPECEAHGNESGSFPIEIELLVAHKSHIFFFVWLKSRKNEVVALPWMCIECAVFQVQTLVNSRIAFYLWTCTVYIAARQRMHTSLCSDGGWRCSIVPLRGACKRNGNTHKLLRTKKLKFFSYYYSDRSGCSCRIFNLLYCCRLRYTFIAGDNDAMGFVRMQDAGTCVCRMLIAVWRFVSRVQTEEGRPISVLQ